MANDRVQRVFLQWQIDERALKEVIAGNRQIQVALTQTQTAAQQTISTADRLQLAFKDIGNQKALDDLAKQFILGRISASDLEQAIDQIGASDENIRRVTNEVTRLHQEMEKAAATDALAATNAGASRGGRTRNPLTGSQRGPLGVAGQQLFLLPDVGPSTEISRGLILVDAAMQAFNLTLTQVALTAGIAAAALPLLVAAITTFNQILGEGRRQVDAAIAAQEAYYNALGTLTSTQVQAAILQLEVGQSLIQGQIDETKTAIQAAESAIQPAANALTDILGALFPGNLAGTDAFANTITEATAGTSGLQERLNELQTEFDENEHTITRFRQGLEAGAFALNDVTDARQSELTQLQRARDLLRTGSSATVNQELANITADNIERTRQIAEIDRALATARAEGNDIAVAQLELERERVFTAGQEANQYQQLLRDQLASIQARELELRALEKSTQAIERNARLQQLLESGTQAQVEAAIEQEQTRLAVAQAEVETYRRLVAAGQPYQAQLAQAEQTVIDATNALADFNGILQDVIASEKAREAATQVEQDLRERARLTEQFNQQQIDAERRHLELIADLGARLDAANDEARIKLAEDEAKARRDLDAQLLEDRIAADERLQDIQEKFDDDNADRLARHNLRLQQIQRRFEIAAANAVAARDALAFFLAKQQRDEDRREENENFRLQQAERRRDFERQKEELRENLAAQQAERQRDYERRLEELRISAQQEAAQRKRQFDRQLQEEIDQFERERTLRQQQYDAEYAALSAHIDRLVALQKSLVGFATTASGKGNLLPGGASGLEKVSTITKDTLVADWQAVMTAAKDVAVIEERKRLAALEFERAKDHEQQRLDQKTHFETMRKERAAEQDTDSKLALVAEATKFRQQRELALREYQKQLQDVQAVYNRERQFKVAVYQRQLQDIAAFANAEIGLRRQYYSAEYQMLAAHIQNLLNLQRSLTTSIQQAQLAAQQAAQRQYIVPQTNFVPASQIQQQIQNEWYGIPRYATGLDYARRTHLGVIDQGEAVLTRQQAAVWRSMMRGGGGGVSVVVNGVGLNRTQIRREVDVQLNKTLKKAGVA